MPLNLSVSDGSEFVPYLKYNAKAGRWFVKNQDGAEVEIINPRLAFDFANIKTGWIMFSKGMGPMSFWDTNGVMAAKPEGDYRRGFYVKVCGGDSLAGVGPLGVRELCSTAGAMINAILPMYEQYERDAPQNAGKVPFYTCTGVQPVAGVHGTNYEPIFQLTAWVDRSRLQFDETATKQVDPFPPPGVTKGMPDMSAHGSGPMPETRPVHAAPDVHAPLGPQGGGAYIPPQSDIADDEIPF